MDSKQAYEPPTIVYSQPLDAVAGVCETSDPVNGKASGTPCTMLIS